MQEELEREKEKRVAHLQQLGVRRLMQQGIARGWSAWLDVYLDYQHKKRMLQTAASRLAKPKLVASFLHWQRDWERETQAQLLAEADAKREAAEAEAAALRGELAKAARICSGRGRGRARLLQEELAAEGEARGAPTAAWRAPPDAAGRTRLVGMARLYLDYQHKKRMLQTDRLAKPKLTAAFVHWQHDWEDEAKAMAIMTQEQQFAEAESKRLIAETETLSFALNLLLHGRPCLPVLVSRQRKSA